MVWCNPQTKDSSQVPNTNRSIIKLFASCRIASDEISGGMSLVSIGQPPYKYLHVTWIKCNVMISFQNEEVLKKCAQEYLSRVKKEEQRYQALKIHAEEKLDR